MSSFTLYTPSEKFYIGMDTIVYLALAICFLPTGFEVIILKHENHQISSFSKGMFLGVVPAMLATLILNIISTFRFKPLRGTVGGCITFENDRIIVRGQEYLLTELEKLDVSIRDYYGKNVGSRYELNGNKSQGVNNKVTLYFTKKQHATFFFRIEDKIAVQSVKQQLIAYHLADKLHFLQLIDSLGISEYEAIQEFKKEIYDTRQI